nr:MAG TPA: hypothetical protein [Caudoviricetes sp.]
MAGIEITVLLWQGFLPFPLSCPCGGDTNTAPLLLNSGHAYIKA